MYPQIDRESRSFMRTPQQNWDIISDIPLRLSAIKCILLHVKVERLTVRNHRRWNLGKQSDQETNPIA